MTTTYQDLLDAEIQTEIERPFKEIIEVQAVRIKELNASYDFTKAQIAELEALRKENAALLVAIEAKEFCLRSLVKDTGLILLMRPDQIRRIESQLTISSSAELLEARDRKRDVKLLRLVASHWNYDQLAYPRSHIENVAHDRESGEWIPEL